MTKTVTRRNRDKIKAAIEKNLNMWCEDFRFTEDDRERIFHDIITDVLPLLKGKKNEPNAD